MEKASPSSWGNRAASAPSRASIIEPGVPFMAVAPGMKRAHFPNSWRMYTTSMSFAAARAMVRLTVSMRRAAFLYGSGGLAVVPV